MEKDLEKQMEEQETELLNNATTASPDDDLEKGELEEYMKNNEIITNDELPMDLYTSDKFNVLKGLDLVKQEDLNYLQEHSNEFQDRFVKRSYFRSEFEMRYGVLSDSEHPTPDSKYWQAIGEQAVHVQEFISLGYGYKKTLADIEYVQGQIEELEFKLKQDFAVDHDFERKKIAARLKKKQVELQEKQFGLVLQRKTAKERMREIKNWTGIIAEIKPQVQHGIEDFEAHHAERYIRRYGQRLQNLAMLGDQDKEHVIKHFTSFAKAPENRELAMQYIKGGQNKQLVNEPVKCLPNQTPTAIPPTPQLSSNTEVPKITKENTCQLDYTSKKEMMEKDPITQKFFNRKVRKILIATPHRNKTDPNVTNFVKMQTPAAFDVILEQPYGFTVPDARNFIVNKAINEEFDYIFFVDDDVLIPKNALVQLIHHKADIVGGFYYRKYYPLESVGMHVNEDDCPVPIEGYKIGDIIHNTLVLPSGITLIKTDVFKNMDSPCYRTCTINNRPTITEDTYFCQKARDLNYDIITDTGIQGVHVDKKGGYLFGHPEIVNANKNQVYENWRGYFAI